MIEENEIKEQSLKDVAQKMIIAARTAPKGKGADTFVFKIAERKDIEILSKKINEMGEKYDAPGFLRDAQNILNSSIMILAGTTIKPMGLKKCGMCGFKDCAQKDEHKNIPCVFNIGDLGIAIGSAVSVAMDHRIDNRIMYSVGQAALEMGILGKDVKIAYAIPLSATSKNPFFDRK
ncbi:MAG: DUF2148 domain-containing protein [Candidatus Aceula lacicola]|nr:DUF2148 domain-containing protein [Candidatus Aceula lacicola]